MSLSPTKRRAEQFADLLEQDARTDDPGMAPLVSLSSALESAAPEVTPDPEFRTALRQRLVAVASVQGVGETQSAAARVRETAVGWRFQRRLALVAGGAAAITAVAGVGIGASKSLPGDAFYGLKRASEDVQLALTRGDEAKGEKHLEFARARLAEVRALAARGEALPAIVPGQPLALGAPQSGDSDLIASTLKAMDAETRAGAEDLFLAYQHSGSVEPLTTLHAFTRKQYAELIELLPVLPTKVQSPAKRSLALLRIVATDTVSLAPKQGSTGGSGGGPTATPRPHPQQSRGSGHTPSTAPTPDTTSSPAGSGTGTGTKQHQPTTPASPGVPTIPPLPSSVPIPTDLPTKLPSLGDLTAALPLPGG
jgi:hypothetical protein